MANVLDLRRRIRSVKSTRQITKAMKMIAAAKLRRAQERAISGRPYASMLASVIGSLMRHTELYDPQTGDESSDSSLTLVSPGTLKVEGCRLVFCRYEMWTRAN